MIRPVDPEDLARLRSDWLERIRGQYAANANASTALALAQALWRCGHYDKALILFQEACEHAPADAIPHVALLRALISLGCREQAESRLRDALRSRVHSPMLSLAGAQLRFDEADPQSALDLLASARDEDPLVALYAEATEGLASGRDPQPRDTGNPAFDARWNGWCWLRSQRPRARISGLPVEVLVHAARISQVEGLVLECGVYFGRSIRVLTQELSQPIHGFDSFEGLPEAWNEREPAGSYSTAGCLPEVPGHVTLHQGWFERSLPEFFADEPGAIRLLHVDCDLYSSTRTVLEAACDRLRPGSMIVFDDFIGFPGSDQHEFRAFLEFAESQRIEWQVRAGCLLGREICIEILSVR